MSLARNRTQRKPSQEYFTPMLYATVNQLYERDFTVLGHPRL
ncbi:MAG: hypothetical protein ACYTFT_04075 [Planctomycetota bacterium]